MGMEWEFALDEGFEVVFEGEGGFEHFYFFCLLLLESDDILVSLFGHSYPADFLLFLLGLYFLDVLEIIILNLLATFLLILCYFHYFFFENSLIFLGLQPANGLNHGIFTYSSRYCCFISR